MCFSFLSYLRGTKTTSLTFAEGEHETISWEHLPAGSGFGCLRSTLAGGVSLRVFKRFPRGMFLWVGKDEEELPGHAIEVRGTSGRPNSTDREKRHGGKIVRAAVVEVENGDRFACEQAGVAPEVRHRRDLAVWGGKTCIRRNKPSSGGHSVWLLTALIQAVG